MVWLIKQSNIHKWHLQDAIFEYVNLNDRQSINMEKIFGVIPIFIIKQLLKLVPFCSACHMY